MFSLVKRYNDTSMILGFSRYILQLTKQFKAADYQSNTVRMDNEEVRPIHFQEKRGRYLGRLDLTDCARFRRGKLRARTRHYPQEKSQCQNEIDEYNREKNHDLYRLTLYKKYLAWVEFLSAGR